MGQCLEPGGVRCRYPETNTSHHTRHSVRCPPACIPPPAHFFPSPPTTRTPAGERLRRGLVSDGRPAPLMGGDGIPPAAFSAQPAGASSTGSCVPSLSPGSRRGRPSFFFSRPYRSHDAALPCPVRIPRSRHVLRPVRSSFPSALHRDHFATVVRRPVSCIPPGKQAVAVLPRGPLCTAGPKAPSLTFLPPGRAASNLPEPPTAAGTHRLW
jgi:hypothetical protein